jgi:hypothetical protein
MVQKPKDPESTVNGSVKAREPVKRFAERGIVETINGNAYAAWIVKSNMDNNVVVAVLKDGRSIGRYSLEEFESGIIDDILVVTNIGGARFNGIALGTPQLHIGYAMPVD